MQTNLNQFYFLRFRHQLCYQICPFFSTRIINGLLVTFVHQNNVLCYPAIEGRILSIPVLYPHMSFVPVLSSDLSMQQSIDYLHSPQTAHSWQQIHSSNLKPQFKVENTLEQQNQVILSDQISTERKCQVPVLSAPSQLTTPKLPSIETFQETTSLQTPNSDNSNNTENEVNQSNLKVIFKNRRSQGRESCLSKPDLKYSQQSQNLENPLDDLTGNFNLETCTKKFVKLKSTKEELCNQNEQMQFSKCHVLLLKLTPAQLLEKAVNKLSFRWKLNHNLTLNVFLRKKQICKKGKNQTQVMKIIDYSMLHVRATQD